jgi:hypothetical protein
MKKIVFCFSFVLFLLHCKNVFFIRDYTPKSMPVEGKAKIALVGFYPFTYSSTTQSRVTTTTATLDYRSPMKKVFPIGKSLDEIPTSGIDVSVPSDTVKEFTLNYLSNVKKSGILEISKMVESKGEGEKAVFSLKKRDVDYYLIGIHGPAFDDSPGNIGRTLLTAHLSILSLGTFPFWGSVGNNSTFLLYDKNLKLIDTKTYSDRYEFIAGWWGKEEHGSFNMSNSELPSHMKSQIYAPQILEYSDYLNEFFQK